jgi:hypothetical protein
VGEEILPRHKLEMKTFSYTFNNGEKYVKLQLPSNKVSEIIKVEDSDSNI